MFIGERIAIYGLIFGFCLVLLGVTVELLAGSLSDDDSIADKCFKVMKACIKVTITGGVFIILSIVLAFADKIYTGLSPERTNILFQHEIESDTKNSESKKIEYEEFLKKHPEFRSKD